MRKARRHILDKRVPLRRRVTILHRQRARPDRVQPGALEQRNQVGEQARALWLEQMSGLRKRGDKQDKKLFERRACRLDVDIGLGDADDASWTTYPLIFLQELAPLPGAQKAAPEALIHQIKERVGEFEHAERIHPTKLHPVADPLFLCLLARIRKDMRVGVHPDQQGRAWRRFGYFDQPPASSAPDIEHAMKTCRVCLLWQDATHANREQMILAGQALDLFGIRLILHDIGRGKVTGQTGQQRA